LHLCKNRKHTDKSLEILETQRLGLFSLKKTVAGDEVVSKLLEVAVWAPPSKKRNLV